MVIVKYVLAMRERGECDPPVVMVQYDRTRAECWNGYGILFAALMMELGLAKGAESLSFFFFFSIFFSRIPLAL
jgi:hypothetical protein